MTTTGSSFQDEPANFQNCEREPIHIPGTIQPHGVLLIIDQNAKTISHASANLYTHFGMDAANAIGKDLAILFGPDTAQVISDWIPTTSDVGQRPALLAVTQASSGIAYDIVGHRYLGRIILELEPSSPQSIDIRQFPGDISLIIERLKKHRTWDELCAMVAREIRDITGFDKVMVYRFDANWNGTVVAETQTDGMDRYMGLRFPAGDIPAQARELYRLNPVRLIPDAGYAASPIVSSAAAHPSVPVDLTYSILRGVSPIHLEYLRNMNVVASMSISILRDGRLWGLIACHHLAPRHVPYDRRVACELIGGVFSLLLGNRELLDEHQNDVAIRKRLDALLNRIGATEQIASIPNDLLDDLLLLVDADGVALCVDGKCICHGQTPPEQAARRLIDWLSVDPNQTVFHSDWLPGEYPAATALGANAAGLLAVNFSRVHRDYVLWFRQEQIVTIHWAGNPNKAVVSDGLRVHPRKSFDTWTEKVGKRSRPWRSAEAHAAAAFRAALLDLTLRRAEESAAKAKDQFMAILSHELRTPLSPVLMAVAALQNDLTLNAEARELLEVIHRNVDVQTRLIDDLLDLTRISKGKLSLNTELLDLHALLDRAIQVCENDANEKGIRMSMHPAAQVHHVEGDPTRLQQIFWNLLRNATKFTSPGGSIEIWTSNVAPGQIRIEIRDTGMGIEPEILPHIFEAYEQGSRTVTRQFGGLGLGLAISRTLTELHGGRLSAMSAGKGLGATFIVDLPAVSQPIAAIPADPAAPAAAADAPSQSAKIKILLVEDHADTARILARLLGQLRYDVRTAATIAAARELIANHSFHLLICDLGLPDGNGSDFMRELRVINPIPAIALSGYGTEEDIQRCRAAGFNYHLIKPVDFRSLKATIRQATAQI